MKTLSEIRVRAADIRPAMKVQGMMTVGNLDSQELFDAALDHKTIDLRESISKPVTGTWEKDTRNSEYIFTARLSDGQELKLGIAGTDSEEWHVAFTVDGSTRVTNQGNAQEIFATVLAALSTKIKQESPKKIIFSAGKFKDDDTPSGRTKLYDHLLTKFATQLGYSWKRNGGLTTNFYMLTRNN